MTNKSIQLPAPTGSFNVGTTMYHLVDTSRKEIYSYDPEHPFRELVMHMWYPAKLQGNETFAPYISSRLKFHIQEMLAKKEPFLFGGSGYIGADVITHAYLNASVSDKQLTYPIILFSPGFGGPHYLSTNLFEELASHGYIVAALNHTYISEPTEFPDGRIIRGSTQWAQFAQNKEELEKAHNRELITWVKDLQFVMDQLALINQQDPHHRFTNKLNLDHIGIMGHSFGGAAAVSLCRIDPRCKAGVDIEGPLFGENQDIGFDKPFMFLFGQPFTVPAGHPNEDYYNKVIKDNQERIAKLYENLTNDVYHIVLKDADHMSFSDWNIITQAKEPGKITHKEVIKITRALLVDFFDKYLKGKTSVELLDNTNQEVKIAFKARK
ncbi:MAG: hypothetical protein NTX86_02315 [Candidatus Dependentiae bacterium]|nr:hypothetical protein [Candidatus Dependentiae bacterium]